MKSRQVPFFLYWHVENVQFWINSIGHLGWLSCISNFPRFHKNVNSLELWKYISENSSPKGYFWHNKKKSEFSELSWDSPYLLAVALKCFPEFSLIFISIFCNIPEIYLAIPFLLNLALRFLCCLYLRWLGGCPVFLYLVHNCYCRRIAVRSSLFKNGTCLPFSFTFFNGRHVQELNPGHIAGRRALSPLHHPCSPTFIWRFEFAAITAVWIPNFSWVKRPWIISLLLPDAQWGENKWLIQFQLYIHMFCTVNNFCYQYAYG